MACLIKWHYQDICIKEGLPLILLDNKIVNAKCQRTVKLKNINISYYFV